jgi:hypothetical protein
VVVGDNYLLPYIFIDFYFSIAAAVHLLAWAVICIYYPFFVYAQLTQRKNLSYVSRKGCTVYTKGHGFNMALKQAQAVKPDPFESPCMPGANVCSPALAGSCCHSGDRRCLLNEYWTVGTANWIYSIIIGYISL